MHERQRTSPSIQRALLAGVGALALLGACADSDDPSARSSSDLSSATDGDAAATDAGTTATDGAFAVPADACAPGVLTGPTLTPKAGSLWPPNHKMHGVSVTDCVEITAGCAPVVQAHFIWASSDEPVNDLGDGNFAPDIQLDDSQCEVVGLRSERQGPKDARFYKLGVRVTDTLGQTAEAECEVVVAHDQSKAPVDSGEAYRITFDGTGGTPLCGGPLPPGDVPPGDVPPGDIPPGDVPPGDCESPPADEPPVTEPPVTEPPVTEPPATEPPATEPPAEEPPGDVYIP